MGGAHRCIVRTWTGDVCVRSSVPGPRYSVSCASIAGWSAGKLSEPKLYHSVSASGPNATVKPSSRKMSSISRITSVTGCRPPCQRWRAGIVKVRGGMRGARRAGRFAGGHGVVEPFANAIERDAGVASPVGGHGRDGFLQLVELVAPFAELAFHGIDSRCLIDGCKSLGELALESRGLIDDSPGVSRVGWE